MTESLQHLDYFLIQTFCCGFAAVLGIIVLLRDLISAKLEVLAGVSELPVISLSAAASRLGSLLCALSRQMASHLTLECFGMQRSS